MKDAVTLSLTHLGMAQSSCAVTEALEVGRWVLGQPGLRGQCTNDLRLAASATGIDSPGPGIRRAVSGRQQGHALSEGTLHISPHVWCCWQSLVFPGLQLHRPPSVSTLTAFSLGAMSTFPSSDTGPP